MTQNKLQSTKEHVTYCNSVKSGEKTIPGSCYTETIVSRIYLYRQTFRFSCGSRFTNPQSKPDKTAAFLYRRQTLMMRITPMACFDMSQLVLNVEKDQRGCF